MMDIILFVGLFAMLIAWLFSVTSKEDDRTQKNIYHGNSLECSNENETESLG